ncbi:hypothetical protein ACPCSE_29335 [Streptomyces cellulosae]
MPGPHAHPDQPRPTPEVDALRALAPDTADVIRVRAAPRTAATGWHYTQAEVLGAYQWPANPGDYLVPLDGTADDSTHASLTVCTFLDRDRYAPIVRLVDTQGADTYDVRLSRPRWEE